MLRLITAVSTVCLLAACGDSGNGGSMAMAPEEPQISGLSDQQSDANSTVGPVEFSISDDETAPDALTVTASFDNDALIRDVSLAGSGATRTVSVTPVTDATGTATVTIRVEDADGDFAEAAFAVDFVLIATAFDSFVRDVFNDSPNGEPRSINARSFDESQTAFDDLVM